MSIILSDFILLHHEWQCKHTVDALITPHSKGKLKQTDPYPKNNQVPQLTELLNWLNMQDLTLKSDSSGCSNSNLCANLILICILLILVATMAKIFILPFCQIIIFMEGSGQITQSHTLHIVQLAARTTLCTGQQSVC